MAEQTTTTEITNNQINSGGLLQNIGSTWEKDESLIIKFINSYEKNDVCFIIAPHQIVDYIVVHELCHILEHNHSPKYWRHIKNVIPNHKECREWLKLNSAALIL